MTNTPDKSEGALLLRELRDLAVALHRKHYFEVKNWTPLDDARGILSQIDNMTAGLSRPADQVPDMVERVARALAPFCAGQNTSPTLAARAAIAALQAVPAASEVGWQPIESAPKDGTRVLLAPHMMTGWWEFGDDEWVVTAIPLEEDRTIANDWTVQPRLFFCLYAKQFGVEPTHWRPLPKPPALKASGEE